jgi:hypothetical protein
MRNIIIGIFIGLILATFVPGMADVSRDFFDYVVTRGQAVLGN